MPCYWLHIMYQHEVDVDMLNTVKSVLADVLSISPSSEQTYLLWWRANARNVSQHTLHGIQHIHINLTLIHCTFYRHTDADQTQTLLLSIEALEKPSGKGCLVRHKGFLINQWSKCNMKILHEGHIILWPTVHTLRDWTTFSSHWGLTTEFKINNLWASWH